MEKLNELIKDLEAVDNMYLDKKNVLKALKIAKKEISKQLLQTDVISRFKINKTILSDFALYALIDIEMNKVVCHFVYDNGEEYCDEMANKIVTNHESFRAKEAKLAGLRGKITDRLDGYVFDDADALGSWRELAERTEVIGTRESDAEPGLGAEENLDVTVGYYDIAISQRWEYLG